MQNLSRIFATSLFLASVFVANQCNAKQHKNVLLICVDDLKPTLGCYGDEVAISPNIDALARRGVVFDLAYCNQAVCAPSRNSLMTGLRPQTIGVYDLATNFRRGAPEAVTMGQFLKRNGYHAAGLGKIYHTGHGNSDDKRTWTVPHWRAKTQTYRSAESTENVNVDSKGRRRYASTERADVADDAYHDGATAIEAAERLAAYAKNPDQPFFLAVGFIRPHLPFVAPEKYWQNYRPKDLPMPQFTQPPKNAPSFAGTNWGELRNYSDIQPKGKLKDSQTRHLIHGYYAATSYMDAQVGRVMKALDQNGLRQNTIVALWGDHGWHLGDHGMWCKHTNYEQAARIPLIISVPEAASGEHTESLFETVDIYPTIAELAGLDLPHGLDGVSQADVVRNPKSVVRDHAIHVYPRGGRLGRAIRTKTHRLVEWKYLGANKSKPIYELYDYESDPLESGNRFGKEPRLEKKLIALLNGHPEPKQRLGK